MAGCEKIPESGYVGVTGDRRPENPVCTRPGKTGHPTRVGHKRRSLRLRHAHMLAKLQQNRWRGLETAGYEKIPESGYDGVTVARRPENPVCTRPGKTGHPTRVGHKRRSLRLRHAHMLAKLQQNRWRGLETAGYEKIPRVNIRLRTADLRVSGGNLAITDTPALNRSEI